MKLVAQRLAADYKRKDSIGLTYWSNFARPRNPTVTVFPVISTFIFHTLKLFKICFCSYVCYIVNSNSVRIF